MFMKIKRPSLKGMKNCGYLGHFAQDKYIQKGHNFSGRPDLKKSKRRSPDEIIITEEGEVYSDSDDPKKQWNELNEFYEKERRSAGWPPQESESIREEEERRINRSREETEKRSDSNKSKDKYDWETTIVKGKRQHRLIRK